MTIQIVNDLSRKFYDSASLIIGKGGVIEFSTEIEFFINVKKFLDIQVKDWYEEGVPQIFMLSFINESGEEDFIDFWDGRITEIELANENEWKEHLVKLVFTVTIDEDEDQGINFFIGEDEDIKYTYTTNTDEFIEVYATSQIHADNKLVDILTERGYLERVKNNEN